VIYDGQRWLSLCETDLDIEDIEATAEASPGSPVPSPTRRTSMNNDQSVTNDTSKVINLDKAQNKRKRLARQARPRAVNRKKAKQPKTKPDRVQRLRNRVERLEARIAKLRSRITVNEGRLAKAKSKLEKAVSAPATGKGQKKAPRRTSA
jgi:hypothetical protein